MAGLVILFVIGASYIGPDREAITRVRSLVISSYKGRRASM